MDKGVWNREEVKEQIVGYMKMYVPDGEPIGAEKIMRLFEQSTCECPLCHGIGRIKLEPNGKPKGDFKTAAKALRTKGLTIRSIASKLGFKHPGSISHLLKQ